MDIIDKLKNLGKKKDVRVVLIDGKKVITKMLPSCDVSDNEVRISNKESYLYDTESVMFEKKIKVIHLIKDIPVSLNYSDVQKSFKIEKKKNVNNNTKIPKDEFGQLDYSKIGKLKEIKNADSKLLKKVLVTKFLSGLLDSEDGLPIWAMPLMVVLNLVLTIAIMLKIYGVVK